MLAGRKDPESLTHGDPLHQGMRIGNMQITNREHAMKGLDEKLDLHPEPSLVPERDREEEEAHQEIRRQQCGKPHVVGSV
jgi:hypothetical protein